MQLNLAGKTAVVTGGTGVLGRVISRALVEEGVNVAVVDLSAEHIRMENQILTIPGDVLKIETLQSAAEKIIAEFGKVDILINGAGGNKPAATTGPDQTFFDIPPDAVQWVFNLNFLGSLLPSQVFGKYMVEQKSGNILNISSMASWRPMTRVVAYAAAKAAINNFTHWLAVYMAQEFSPNLRVNAIAPGFFQTEQNRYLLTDKETGQLTPRGHQILSHTPMSRFGQPEDLVGAVLWLVSDAAQFVTGIVVPIDGGFSAYSGV
jgi:NAD(P)-dependent dehydrogenase (short-subunit alcohol dehydrogenase family)